MDERHRSHASDSNFGIHIPSEPLKIPFTLEGVIAGFDSRQPTPNKLDDTTLHIELTSDAEWDPHSFTLSLAEEEIPDDADDEDITKLRARRLKTLHSRTTKLKIESCTQTLAASQFPFELQITNEVDTEAGTDPILRRILAVAKLASLEGTGVAAIRFGEKMQNKLYRLTSSRNFVKDSHGTQPWHPAVVEGAEDFGESRWYGEAAQGRTLSSFVV